MHDPQIRAALHERIRSSAVGTHDRLIVDEFSIDGLDRIDIATVSDCLTGFEIKSPFDRVDRLNRQVPSYSRVMDYIYLVTTKAQIKESRPIIPRWWGIIEAKSDGKTVELAQIRKSTLNRRTDPSSVAGLLWRDEALKVLENVGLDKGFRTKPRHDLCERLASELPLPELKALVREQLRVRHSSRESPAPRRSDVTWPLADSSPRFLARRLRQPHR